MEVEVEGSGARKMGRKTYKHIKTMIVLVDGQKDQKVDSFWWMVDFFGEH